MAARSASPGAGGVFICASPIKAYDTDENRVLVAALHRGSCGPPGRPSRRSTGPASRPRDDLRRARHNGERARRALEHRSLQARRRGPAERPHAAEGPHRHQGGVFRTAVALLQRSWAEVGADDLAPFVDERTRGRARPRRRRRSTSSTASGRLTERLRIVDGAGSSAAPSPTATPAATTPTTRAGVHVDGRPSRRRPL